MSKQSARLALFLPILTLFLAACLPQTAVPPEEAPIETAVLITATAVPDPATATPLPQPSPSATSLRTEPPPSATIESEMNAEPTSQPESAPTLQPAVQQWVDLAIADLARRTGLPVEEIEFLSFQLTEWSDSSLGCPQPGMMYAQVLQEGYLIQLQANDQVYNYHGGSGAPFLCEQKELPEEITKQPPLTLKGTPTISIPPPRD